MKWTRCNKAGNAHIVQLGVLCLVSLAHGFTDSWGDNLRPKLHTDYLTQYSGKAKVLRFKPRLSHLMMKQWNAVMDSYYRVDFFAKKLERLILTSSRLDKWPVFCDMPSKHSGTTCRNCEEKCLRNSLSSI
jgi:hypothetical protein